MELCDGTMVGKGILRCNKCGRPELQVHSDLYDSRCQRPGVPNREIKAMRISDEEVERLASEADAFMKKYEGSSWYPPPQMEDGLALDLRDARNQLKRAKMALEAVLADIADYERVNHLYPSPGHKDCWQSVTNAKEALEQLK